MQPAAHCKCHFSRDNWEARKLQAGRLGAAALAGGPCCLYIYDDRWMHVRTRSAGSRIVAGCAGCLPLSPSVASDVDRPTRPCAQEQTKV